MKTKKKKLKPTLQRVGTYLKALREKKGYKSLKEFTSDYDLPMIQYWRIENGKTNFTLKSLDKLLNIHRLSVEDFFCGLKK